MLDGMGKSNRPPAFIVRAMEVQITYLFIVYGFLMAILAIWFATSTWVFFKTAGLYIILAIFMGAQLYLNKKRMRQHWEKNPPTPPSGTV